MPHAAAVLPTPSTRRSNRRSSRTHELRWRLIRDEPLRGAANMAFDHALAECLGTDQGVVRLYGWDRPTVSFGRNEPASRASVGGLDYVRRPTGGRAVLHHEELTYSVVAPPQAFGGLRDAYLRINESLAEAMRHLGASVEVVDRHNSTVGAGAARPDAGPCFQTPAPGEIVAGGRKLVGSAQARVAGALLQHGSILLGGDQRILGGTPGSTNQRGEPVTLAELVGDVSREAVALAAARSLSGNFGGTWLEDTYDARELEAAARLQSDRYGLDTWTWRR